MKIVDKNSPVGLRLACRFWIELGRPPRFRSSKILEAWSPKMESLWRRSGLGYEEFRWFLVWLCRLDDEDGARYGNDWTARNLRSAKDPMASLDRQFMRVFFEFFMPKADKVIPLLIGKREMEEAEVRLAAAAEKPLRYVDIVPEDASKELVKNAQDLDRLDSAFPMRGPLGEESTEAWIMR